MSGGGGIIRKIGSLGGNLVKSVTPGSALGSVVGSLGGVGEVLGPAIQLGAGANPLGVFGASLGSRVLKDFTSAGGDRYNPVFVDSSGKVIYAKPGVNYGSSTYRLGKKALNADPYFIQGSKGIYNLLPELSRLYGNKDVKNMPGTNSYNVYQSIYDRMAGDTLAQQELASRYGPQTFTPTASTGFRDQINLLDEEKYLDRDIRRAAIEAREAGNLGPIQYVDWGFGKGAVTRKNPWEALSNYAGKKSNPFFMAFDPQSLNAQSPETQIIVPDKITTPTSTRTASSTSTSAATDKASGGIIELMKNKQTFGKD